MSLAVSAMFNVSFKNDLDKRALICPSAVSYTHLDVYKRQVP